MTLCVKCSAHLSKLRAESTAKAFEKFDSHRAHISNISLSFPWANELLVTAGDKILSAYKKLKRNVFLNSGPCIGIFDSSRASAADLELLSSTARLTDGFETLEPESIERSGYASATELQTALQLGELSALNRVASKQLNHISWSSLMDRTTGGGFHKTYSFLESMASAIKLTISTGKHVDIDSIVLNLVLERLEILKYFRDSSNSVRKSTAQQLNLNQVDEATEITILSIFKAKAKLIKASNLLTPAQLSFHKIMIEPILPTALASTQALIAARAAAGVNIFDDNSSSKLLKSAVQGVTNVAALKIEVSELKKSVSSKRNADSSGVFNLNNLTKKNKHELKKLLGDKGSVWNNSAGSGGSGQLNSSTNSTNNTNNSSIGPNNTQVSKNGVGKGDAKARTAEEKKQIQERINNDASTIKGKLDSHQVGNPEAAKNFLKDIKLSYGLPALLRAFSQGTPDECCRNCFAAGKGLVKHTVAACAKLGNSCHIECPHSLCDGGSHWVSDCPNKETPDPNRKSKGKKGSKSKTFK